MHGCLQFFTKCENANYALPHVKIYSHLSELVHFDARWCIISIMSTIEKAIRQSVSLPSPIARRVKALAKSRKVSSNRILVELVESGLRSKEEEKRKFLELADRLSMSTNSTEQQELKEQLARMTFGE